MSQSQAMEKRRSRRITVKLKAESLSGAKNKGVFIENISTQGIHILTDPSHTATTLTSGTELDLKFQLPSGETLTLRCIIKWSYPNIPPNGVTNSIGLEIINPPLKYKEFVKSLY